MLPSYWSRTTMPTAWREPIMVSGIHTTLTFLWFSWVGAFSMVQPPSRLSWRILFQPSPPYFMCRHQMAALVSRYSKFLFSRRFGFPFGRRFSIRRWRRFILAFFFIGFHEEDRLKKLRLKNLRHLRNLREKTFKKENQKKLRERQNDINPIFIFLSHLWNMKLIPLHSERGDNQFLPLRQQNIRCFKDV